MLVIPVYDLALLPGASLYLKKEYYEELAGKQAEQGASVIFLMLKQHKQRPDIKPEDIYPIAVTGVVESVDEDGTVNVRALARVRLSQADLEANLVQFVECTEIQDLTPAEVEERFKRVRSAMLKFSNQFQWGVIARQYILNWHSLAEMVTALSSQLNISSEEKYQMLETDVLSQRVELMEKALYEMIEVNRVSGEAQQAVSKSNEMVYREEALKRQIEFLQKQLDDMHPENVSDIRKFEQAIAQSGMNDIAEKEARKVLNRMKQEGQNGHEYGLLYDYLDFVTGLAWKKAPFERIALDRAEEILDEDHYGLKKAKKRIIQQIAVMALNQKQAGSILLFVGAPGTGKTSIGQSIARALKRPYARVSLGGVRDEAEIRGHRRTYVGAMPGRIMDGIRRSGASNPVVVLDEVDKLGKDYNGDPSSALLEVLDPEQNSTFTDHYMNVPYDLSDVLFIC